MAATASPDRREVHHRVPRCLLKAWDRGHGPGLEPEDLAAWFDWEEEAYRYGVNPDVSRTELVALIEGSTVEIAGDEHRAGHSAAGDFTRWGRRRGPDRPNHRDREEAKAMSYCQHPAVEVVEVGPFLGSY